MPVFDRLCFACGWVAVDVFEPIQYEAPLCPECGTSTERVWLTKPPNVVSDSCDFVSRNGEKHPVRFRSRADHRRWLKEKGYAINDNRSGHSSTGGVQWLKDAEVLATRNGAARGEVVPDDDPLHVTFTAGELTPAQVEEYRRRNR